MVLRNLLGRLNRSTTGHGFRKRYKSCNRRKKGSIIQWNHGYKLAISK